MQEDTPYLEDSHLELAHSESHVSDSEAVLVRRERSRAYDIARKAFSRSKDIEPILLKHEGEFRQMIADAYADMEADFRDSESFTNFTDSY